MVRENIVTPANFIYPLFIHDEEENQDIASMPGCQRHTLASMLKEVGEALELGVMSFVLFPKVDDALKTNLACEAYNPEGIVHRAIRMIKEKHPEAIVVTDVALDPYSDQGHDGVVENGVILNDITINQLCKQAVSQARAGCDIVAPSDMQVSLKMLFMLFYFVANAINYISVSIEWIRENCYVLFPLPPIKISCAYDSDANSRMDVLELSVTPSTPKDSPTFQSFPTLPNMPLPTTAPSVMPSTLTPALETKRLTNKTLLMVVRLSLKPLSMPLREPICSW